MWIVMVTSANPDWNKFWIDRLKRYGNGMHIYRHKELAKSDARKFTKQLGYKYEAVKIK